MISIIVPVYNTAKYLRQCVDSILAQTYRDIEIILVDDGSTDESPAICDEYANMDARIRVIHKSNGGLSDARNCGIDAAEGEYIAFVDSDDFVGERMFEHLVSLLEECDCDISLCGCAIVDENGEKYSYDAFNDKEILRGAEIIEKVVLPLKTAVWNKLFNRKSIGLCRFPKGRIHGEDLVFFMNIIDDGTKIVTSSYIGYNYVKHQNSITTGKFKDSAFDEIWCKDVSCGIMAEKFPQYGILAKTWSFRARLNLIRKMLRQKDISYAELIVKYKKWLCENYYVVLNCLDNKTKYEFLLFRYCKPVYLFLLKFI